MWVKTGAGEELLAVFLRDKIKREEERGVVVFDYTLFYYN